MLNGKKSDTTSLEGYVIGTEIASGFHSILWSSAKNKNMPKGFRAEVGFTAVNIADWCFMLF